MHWGDYAPYDPGVDGPLQDQARAAAQAAFAKLMKDKGSRKLALSQLLAANGIELDTSNGGIQRLNDWFRDSVEPDPGGEPETLRSIWYSVVNDIALFLGDVIIERAPNLRWDFLGSGRKDISFQRHVILGFPVPNPLYNIDVDLRVAIHAQRIVSGLGVRNDEFVQMIASAVELAHSEHVTG
jgi:hypothetical protein